MATLPVWTTSLGCPKNMVDTERLLGALGSGLKITPHIGRSKLVFINTCGFIEPAVRESIREILGAARHAARLKNPPPIVVAGCLVGRYGKAQLARELPEVDLWLAPDEIDQWGARIAELLNSPERVERARHHPELPYAWLKISDGCDHKCSFCTIPAIRGKHRPESLSAIMLEAGALVRQGVRELILVGQDVSAWRDGEHDLADLLTELAQLPDLHWLRLLYLYPRGITPRLLETMASLAERVLPYLDVPFQHSQASILKEMGRPFTEDPRAVIDRIRAVLPAAALRTSLIAGFPGESEKDFDALCQFVRDAQFHNLGVFCYCAEEGTPAAALPGQIPEAEKERRRQILMDIQAGVSSNILAQYQGCELDVLADRELPDEWPGLYAGRVWFQAPEIDGITYVSGPGISSGTIKRCRIEQTMTYDLNALA